MRAIANCIIRRPAARRRRVDVRPIVHVMPPWSQR